MEVEGLEPDKIYRLARREQLLSWAYRFARLLLIPLGLELPFVKKIREWCKNLFT